MQVAVKEPRFVVPHDKRARIPCLRSHLLILQAPMSSALPDAAAGLLACIGALSFLGATAFRGAMVAGKDRILEMLRSGKKEAFGGSVRRRNGRNDGRDHHAQLYRPVAKDVAGPTGSPTV